MTLHTALSIVCASAVLGLLAIEARDGLIVMLHGEVMPEPDKDCRLMRELPDDEVGEWHLRQV